MNRTIHLQFLLAALLQAGLLCAQVNTLHTFQLEGSQASMANDALESFDGRIALAGWQNTLENGRQASLVMLNSKWMLEAQHNFGEGACNAIVQAFDGAFVLAGYNSAPGNGHKSAWLFKADETGRICWQWKDPDPDSEWHDVVQLPDGSLIAVGEKKGQPAVLRVGATGQEMSQSKIEKVGAGVAYAIAPGPRNQFGIAGASVQSGGKQCVFFAETDTLLRTLRADIDQTVALPAMQGRSIAYDLAFKRYLIGAGGTALQPGQAVFYTVKNAVRSADLQIASQQKGQTTKNLIASVTALPDGSWLLAGASNAWGSSGNVGTFRPLLLRVPMDAKGMPAKEPAQINLSDKHEKTLVHSIVLLHDGTLLSAGETEGRLWALRASLPGARLPKSVSRVSVSDVRFVEPGRNDTLNAWERGYLRFTVRNEGPSPVWGLRARVEARGDSWGLRYSHTVWLGHLSGNDTLARSIPVAGESFLSSGLCSLSVSLLDASGRVLAASFSTPFPMQEDPPPVLALSLAKGMPDSIPREEHVPLSIWVKNTGKGLARNVQVDFNGPYWVATGRVTPQPIDSLSPMDSVELHFWINVGYLYMEDVVTARLKAYEQNNDYLSKCYKGIRFRVSSFFDIKPPGKPLLRLHEIERQMRKGGPSRPSGANPWKGDRFQVLWSFLPDPRSLRDSFLRDSLTGTKGRDIPPFYDNSIILRAWVIPESGTLYDQAYYRENLSLNWDLKESKTSKNTTQPLFEQAITYDTLINGQYFFFRRTNLLEGSNAFTIKATDARAITVKCPSFTVRHTPPTTHCFIFGIHYDDADSVHTAQNARKFGEVMKKQADIGFIKTAPGGIHIWTEEDSTSTQSVSNLLRYYFGQGYYYNPDHHGKISNKNCKIGPFDQIVLYFSAHSLGNEPPFDLLFPQNSKQHVFQRDVMSELYQGAFRRVFLYLDVCNSGLVVQQVKKKAAGENAPWKKYATLFDPSILPDSSYYHIYASCAADESAAEIDTLGLWTLALTQAFENKKITSDEDGRIFCSDENQDHVLSSAELQQFLLRWVKMQVRTYNKAHPKTPFQQTPCASTSDGTGVGKVSSNH